MNPVVHFEMPYEDKDRMALFYQKTFGWKLQMFGPEMGNYVVAQTSDTDEKGMIKEPGRINGGFFKKSPDNQHPSVVIVVDDITDAIDKVTQGGGTAVSEILDIPGIGRYAGFSDTEGNRVSLLQPKGM